MAHEATPKPSHLEPSPLGTKEYWDKLYATEISNYAADSTDVGTIWFDDSAAEDKVLSFLHSPDLDLDLYHTSFLDIGTGNGHFIFRLLEAHEDSSDEEANDEGRDEDEARKEPKLDSGGGFQGRMLGTDYSNKSIEFATQLAATTVPPDAPISFLHFDIMASAPSLVLTHPNEDGWDVVLDKGTFDAISLSSATDKQGRKICEGYKERIVPLMREGGLFVVTSCNWTEIELRTWFEGGEFVVVGAVGYQRFMFGGREGQSVSTVCFRKVGMQ